jgi:hypothetical protein
MGLPKHSPFAPCVILFGAILSASLAPGAAYAQEQHEQKPFDFKPLIPPIFPVPPQSQVQSGSVGGSQTPYTTAPLQDTKQAPTQSAPGIRLSIPTK